MVAVEARRAGGERLAAVIPLESARDSNADERPAPSLGGCDELLEAGR